MYGIRFLYTFFKKLKTLMYGLDKMSQKPHQFIHRDIKSNNIVINNRFETKFIDFGISSSFQGDAEKRNSTYIKGYYIYPLNVAMYHKSHKYSSTFDLFAYGRHDELLDKLLNIYKTSEKGIKRIETIYPLDGRSIYMYTMDKTKYKYTDRVVKEDLMGLIKQEKKDYDGDSEWHDLKGGKWEKGLDMNPEKIFLKIDVFSMGIILYKIWRSMIHFHINPLVETENLPEKYKKLIQSKTQPIPKSYDKLQYIIRKCLCFLTKERFSSRELHKEYENFLVQFENDYNNGRLRRMFTLERPDPDPEPESESYS